MRNILASLRLANFMPVARQKAHTFFAEKAANLRNDDNYDTANNSEIGC